MPHETVDPATQGVWTGAIRTPGDSRTLDDGEGVFPVHTILLRTGRVLMFSGGWESSDLLHRSWTFDPDTYDPATPTVGVIGRWFLPEFDDDPIANPPPPTGADDPDIDLFCAHHVQIEDGRIMVVGGDGISGHTNDSIHFYDPDLERWSRIPEEMVAGRWYPTATHLPDDSVVAFTSHLPVADTELMSPPDYVPRVISGGRRQTDGSDNPQSSFPGMFLVPGGKLFYIPVTFRYRAPSGLTNEEHVGNTMSFEITDALSDPPVGVWQDHGITPTVKLREEGTSVLLSPAQAGRIAMIGGRMGSTNYDTIEILETQGASPQWVDGGRMIRTRANVNVVLLPDGKALILGGTGGDKWESNPDDDLRRFTAEIWDPGVPVDPADPSAAFTETGSMHRGRCYHSTGLLLPDGRVLVAGGDDRLGVNDDGLGPQPGERVDGDSSQRTMEFYEPPYMHNGPRPVIDGISETGAAADEIRYSGRFTIETTATDIAMVALMRPGAPTHHTDTEQRHIPLTFWPVDGGYRAQVTGDGAVAPPGYYMVWIVDDEGRPCERAPFVRLSHRGCDLITDRSQFSIHDVQTELTGGVAQFDSAFFVAVDGYRPEQLGITTTTPTQAQLDAWGPSITFADVGGGPVVGLSAPVAAMHLEVADVAVPQRVTFELGVRFTGTAMFPAPGVGDERRPLVVTSEINGHTCVGAVDLFLQPNPFMVDGQTHWLSNDLRVFQIRPGQSQSGVTFPGGGTPVDFLAAFLAQCDSTADSAGHPFRLLPTNQQAAALELASEVDGEPVYNFAVARVHYQSVSTPAMEVRVFFRAFTTAATSMEYRAETYPVDTVADLPEVGQNATDVLTIPFFSVARGDLGAGDTQNVKTVPASGAGGETFRYFGAWLDINQTTPVITDPADGVTKSVQDLIRGKHQCLVSEINFGPDPIPEGATPANNENLSQRNLAILESDNPGPRDAHTVTHTFQLKTTFPAVRRGLVTHHHMEALDQKLTDPSVAGFDELIILWGGLPEDTEATLYTPAIDADDVLRAAAYRYGAPRLEKVDEHTIRCRVGDISYVPLPAARPTPVGGLVTLTLPPTVRTGEEYKVLVRQHSRVEGRITGLFDITIPVLDAEDILPGEARFLSVLKSIAGGVSPSSGWFPVFERYLSTVADRVGGLGADPEAIEPSPAGTGVPDAIDQGGAGFPWPGLDEDGGRDEACCEELTSSVKMLTWLTTFTLIVLLLLLLLLILWR